MTEEEIKVLAKKVVERTASKEESLAFMQEFNNLLEELKGELKK